MTAPRPPYREITPLQLVAAAHEVIGRHPGATLAKNQVGNLSIIVDETYVGFVNLNTGEVAWIDEMFDDEPGE